MATSRLPTGVYANLTNATSAGAKTEIKALVDVFLALLPNPTGTGSTNTNRAIPLYDKIPPEICSAIRTELTALKAAITAGA